MQSRGVEIPMAEGLSESMSRVVAACRGDFVALVSTWAVKLEAVLRIKDAICLNFVSTGQKKTASFLWGGWEEKDLLFVLTFCPASERLYAVEQLTIHSRFFTPPHLRCVGVKLAEASWDFLYEKFFRTILLGRLRSERQEPHPIEDPVIILELFDRLSEEENRSREAMRRSESKT